MSDVLGLGVDKPKLRTATPALHGPTTLCAAMQRFGGAAASHWQLWVGGLATMAAGRLKSDSHMQAPHRGAQLVVTASHPPHWPRGGQTKPQTHRPSLSRHRRATSASLLSHRKRLSLLILPSVAYLPLFVIVGN